MDNFYYEPKKAIRNHDEVFDKLRKAGLYDKVVAKNMIRESNYTGIMYVCTMPNSNRKFRVRINGYWGSDSYPFYSGPYDSIVKAVEDALLIRDKLDAGTPMHEMMLWHKQEFIDTGRYNPQDRGFFMFPRNKSNSPKEEKTILETKESAEEITQEPLTIDDYILLMVDILDSLPAEKVVEYYEATSKLFNERLLNEIKTIRTLVNPDRKYTEEDMKAMKAEMLRKMTDAVA